NRSGTGDKVVDDNVIDNFVAGSNVAVARTVHGNHVGVHLTCHLTVVAVWRLWVAGGVNLQRANFQTGAVQGWVLGDWPAAVAGRTRGEHCRWGSKDIANDVVRPHISWQRSVVGRHGVLITDNQVLERLALQQLRLLLLKFFSGKLSSSFIKALGAVDVLCQSIPFGSHWNQTAS